MPEIRYESLLSCIKDCSGSFFDPVYLVFGEEFLYRQAVKAIVDAIIPDSARQRREYEIIDQKDGGRIADVIERLNTYGFFSGKKVIELRDPAVFATQQNPEKLVQRVKKTYDQDRDRAAALFLEMLARLNLSLEDMHADRISEGLGLETSDMKWMLELAAYCSERQLPMPDAGSGMEQLKTAIERGFPKNNHLIISTDTVDRRTGLYQAIKKIGTVVDCSVAAGTRKAEKEEQGRLLLQHFRQVLRIHHKEAEPRVFDFMQEMIGFDLHGFANSLEKLIDYVGDRQRIRLTDAQAVLKQAREDPVYELTGAICSRNTQDALYYLSSLLSSGYHYLQLLTAMTRQVRTLLLIKGFTESRHGECWRKGMDFNRFKTDVLPAIRRYDEEVLNHLQDQRIWGKPASGQEVALIKPGEHPYALYQSFLKSENFQTPELEAALEALHQADLKLKTQGQDPRFILEAVIFKICPAFRA